MSGTKRSLALLSALAAVFWLAGSVTMQAQRFRTLSEPAYQEMRRLAQRLEERAQSASDQAQRQQSTLYRRDNRLTRAVYDFARRASRFDQRIANYRETPWQVDEDLRNLARRASDVQSLVRRSRYTDERILADWDDTVRLLNRMIRLYEADARGLGRYEYGAPPGGPESRPSRPEYRGGYGDARPPGTSGYPQDRLVMLSRELADRAARAHELAERLSTGGDPRLHQFFEAIHRFDTQARDFNRRVESGQADPRTIREEARHLLEDARLADRDMRQNNVFPEVWEEWRGAMQALQRILDLAGA